MIISVLPASNSVRPSGLLVRAAIVRNIAYDMKIEADAAAPGSSKSPRPMRGCPGWCSRSRSVSWYIALRTSGQGLRACPYTAHQAAHQNGRPGGDDCETIIIGRGSERVCEGCVLAVNGVVPSDTGKPRAARLSSARASCRSRASRYQTSSPPRKALIWKNHKAFFSAGRSFVEGVPPAHLPNTPDQLRPGLPDQLARLDRAPSPHAR